MHVCSIIYNWALYILIVLHIWKFQLYFWWQEHRWGFFSHSELVEFRSNCFKIESFNCKKAKELGEIFSIKFWLIIFDERSVKLLGEFPSTMPRETPPRLIKFRRKVCETFGEIPLDDAPCTETLCMIVLYCKMTISTSALLF